MKSFRKNPSVNAFWDSLQNKERKHVLLGRVEKKIEKITSATALVNNESRLWAEWDAKGMTFIFFGVSSSKTPFLSLYVSCPSLFQKGQFFCAACDGDVQQITFLSNVGQEVPMSDRLY